MQYACVQSMCNLVLLRLFGLCRYELDSRGNLCSFSNQPGTFAKPYDNDGARAVAALAAQVCLGHISHTMQQHLQDHLQFHLVHRIGPLMPR